MRNERFLEAAQRVLEGDDSTQAAQVLEGVVLDDYPGHELFDNLAYVLSLYAPGHGRAYTSADEVRAAVREAVGRLEL